MLHRQPGTELTGADEVRAIAQSAKTAALQLAPLRNAYGTGHGVAALADVEDELLHITVDAALLWVRWALRRLDRLLFAQPTQLIDDLQVATFTRGLFAERLLAADLPSLGPGDQRLVGRAVGARATEAPTIRSRSTRHRRRHHQPRRTG